MEKTKITYHVDDYNGWYEVPLAALQNNNITRIVSQKTVIDNTRGIAYLDHDSDGSNFLDFLRHSGIQFRFVTKYKPRSFIRDLIRN
jgi:hypothetical protein